MTTFVHSTFFSHDNKLDMVHIQNSTLAGGVGVGAVCNLLIGPVGAIGIGVLAGAVSVLGYRYLSVSVPVHVVLIGYLAGCISRRLIAPNHTM